MRFYVGPDGREMVELTAKSYRAAQERQRLAEVRLYDALDRVVSAERWARDSLDQERRAHERCQYLYGVAAAQGASQAQLAGPGTHGYNPAYQMPAMQPIQPMHTVAHPPRLAKPPEPPKPSIIAVIPE